MMQCGNICYTKCALATLCVCVCVSACVYMSGVCKSVAYCLHAIVCHREKEKPVSKTQKYCVGHVSKATVTLI